MSKGYARGFYNSKAWKDTQPYIVSQHYVCERCGDPARIVHHIRYITPQSISDPAITLDWGNLEALCIDCHNIEHSADRGLPEGLRFDESGNIVPI